MEHSPCVPLCYEQVARHARSISGTHIFSCVLSWFADCKHHVQFWKGWSQETDSRKQLKCVRYINIPIWFRWLFFIEFNIFKCPSYPVWSFLYTFCRHKHTHTHTHAHTHTDMTTLFYPCCKCACGITINAKDSPCLHAHNRISKWEILNNNSFVAKCFVRMHENGVANETIVVQWVIRTALWGFKVVIKHGFVHCSL